MTEYYIGQIFIETYPEDAAEWCNGNNAYIDEIEPEDGKKRFEIFEQKQPTPEERKARFLKDFFKVSLGDLVTAYYRKKPKGYQSAVESINSAYNTYTETQKLGLVENFPAGTLIFYQEPDFTKPEECTEDWLVAHQILNPEMTPQQFGQFYVGFIQAWNTQEH